MALTSTEQLFLERPWYKCFLHNDNLTLFPVTSKNFLCNVTGFTIFQLSPIVFYWRFRVRFISTEKWNNKGKYPDGVQIIIFSLEKRFVWRQRFPKEIWQMEFDVAVRGISLGKRFSVVSTWRAPVRKRPEQSTVQFAHTFLTSCCTKSCLRFF